MKILDRVRAICATDEYAIRAFISFCRIQLRLVIDAPNILILIIHGLIEFMFIKQIGIMRINPYPPNLRRMAAKIIDPSKGASTWAFGNHR